jgi:hypothetical protein
MRFNGRTPSLLLAGVFAAGLLTFGGCTKYAGPDDLKKLDEADKAATLAEKDLAKAKAERRDLEKKLAVKETELAAAKAEAEKIKSQ